MLFIEYPKCTTCQKAKKWLEANHIEFEDRHIVEQNPTEEELKIWIKESGLPCIGQAGNHERGRADTAACHRRHARKTPSYHREKNPYGIPRKRVDRGAPVACPAADRRNRYCAKYINLQKKGCQY